MNMNKCIKYKSATVTDAVKLLYICEYMLDRMGALIYV